MYQENTILITGATGSLGTVLVDKAIDLKFKKIVVFSRDEHKQHTLRKRHKGRKIRYMIGDVRDAGRLSMAFRGIDYVLHAAALKHVYTGERDPAEVVKTTVQGAENIIRAAIENNVEKVVNISTDKAVNPICLYGAAKLCADKLFQSAGVYSGDRPTRFASVRFGNFWNSRGSVVEYYNQLCQMGERVFPITSLDMKRWFIDLGVAADFVYSVLTFMKGGEIYVPKMRELRIVDVAREIDPDVQFHETGIPRGEKVQEELLNEDDLRNCTETEYYWVVR